MSQISERTRYRCERCGHEWNSRVPLASKRECSKCGSTRATIVSKADGSGVTSSTSAKTLEAPASPSVAVPGSVAKDPEVYEKMKELQLVRLEKQITEEKEGKVETTALEHLDGTFKMLVLHLERMHALETDISMFLHTYCNWCGSSGRNGTHYDEALGGWRCGKCGHVSM